MKFVIPINLCQHELLVYFIDNEFDNEITELVIPFIDRGIDCFIEFAKVLKDLFPNLKILNISQNYSYNQSFTDFVEFVKILGLKQLILQDSQSLFMCDLINSKQLLFNVMKPDSSCEFILECNTEYDCDCGYRDCKINHCICNLYLINENVVYQEIDKTIIMKYRIL